MQTPIPDLRIGDPAHHESISIFPLFAEGLRSVDYILAEEAIHEGTLRITEKGKSGDVGQLTAENEGSNRILLMEGQLLSGAKQDRAVNTSLLLPAKSTVTIPVSCVEQGRWAWSSRTFTAERRHVPPSLRRGLKQSVTRALQRRGVPESDQAGVWSDVQGLASMHASESPSDAIGGVYEARSVEVTQTRVTLPHIEGATGFVVANGARLASFDCFDRAETCRAAWEHSTPGMALDVRPKPTDEGRVTAEDVERFLDMIRVAAWNSVPTIGDGQEMRAETALGISTSALVLGDDLVHASAAM